MHVEDMTKDAIIKNYLSHWEPLVVLYFLKGLSLETMF